ncbi:MAG: XisI protein [Saprospiraceae bacterium]|nr:XisI protein [Saprospiraceae bacterium]
MEKIDRYRAIIKDVLTEYAAPRKTYSDGVETQLLFDTENDHYQALISGWTSKKQVFLVAFHFDIKNGKIWLQQNNTDYDIIKDLEDRHVPKEDIVLAVHSPLMRQFTDYAVA